MLVLCGDLTNFGKTGEAEILAEDIRACTDPGVGVLGNHDYECGQPEEVCEILHEAGMTVLDEQAIEIDGVGFAGVKGFLGGFGRGELAPFGEPTSRRSSTRRMNEARKLENRCARCAPSAASLSFTIRRSPKRSRASRRDLPVSRLAAPVPIRSTASTTSRRSSTAMPTTAPTKATPSGTPVYNVAQFVLKPLFGKPYAFSKFQPLFSPGIGGRRVECFDAHKAA